MIQTEKPKKQKMTTEQLVEYTANATATAVIKQQRQARLANLYRAMERLLRSYPKLKRRVEDIEDYFALPGERSKSITIAPPSGSAMRDHTEIVDDIISAKSKAYADTKAKFDEIDSIVRQYEQQPEFIVIRMYYFGEDAHGNERDPDSKRYTFEEISEELASINIFRSEKTLRSWRTQLVQDMTVTLFGVDGALSVESREKPTVESPKATPNPPKEG